MPNETTRHERNIYGEAPFHPIPFSTGELRFSAAPLGDFAAQLSRKFARLTNLIRFSAMAHEINGNKTLADDVRKELDAITRGVRNP